MKRGHADRPKVFDAVAAGLAAQNIYVHLDNHVSKAMWCCSLTDGNSWFGDTYFDTDKWIRGLSYMANHVSFPTLRAMGLTNYPGQSKLANIQQHGAPQPAPSSVDRRPKPAALHLVDLENVHDSSRLGHLFSEPRRPDLLLRSRVRL